MALESSASVVIFQGEDKDITIKILERRDDGNLGDPVDLASATEIAVLFPKTDGGALIKKLTTGGVIPLRAAAGIFKVRLSAADTKLLKIGEGLNLEARYTIEAFVSVVQLPGAINVLATFFPNAIV